MADQFSPVPVKGLKTNNNAAAGASNVGVLPAIATNVAPTYTEGNQVGLSTDLTGALRTSTTFTPSGTQDTNLKQVNGVTTLVGNGVTGTGSQRVTIASDNTPFGVKIIDTGGTNQLAVDASGRVSVLAITNALPAGANAIGTVTAVGNVASGASDSGNPVKIGGVFNTSAPTLTNGQRGDTQLDTNANLKVNLITAIPTGANVIGSVNQNGTWNVGLSTGSNLVGKVGIDQTTVGTTNAVSFAQIGATTVSTSNGVTGAGVQRTILTSDYLSTVQVSKNTTINSVSNPIFSQLSDGTTALGTASNPLNVFTMETTGTLKDSGTLTSSAVAAGATVNLDTAVVTNAVTGKLLQLTCSSSVRIKVEAETITGAGPTVVSKRVFFVGENESLVYSVPDSDTFTIAGNGTNSKFRLAITNMDNLNAADVYGSVTWIEA